jgi:hypothetical protein
LYFFKFKNFDFKELFPNPDSHLAWDSSIHEVIKICELFVLFLLPVPSKDKTINFLVMKLKVVDLEG